MNRFLPVTRSLLAGHRAATVWFWGIVFAAFAAVTVAIAALGELDVSVWDYAAWGAPRYFLGAIGVMLTAVYLPMYVAHGVTRHQFSAAGLGFAVVVTAGFALVLTVGYVVEWLVHRGVQDIAQLGRPHRVDSVGDALATLGMYTLIMLAYLVSGWLAGSAYYRLGWLRGSLLLPVALVPAVVSDAAFWTGWLGAGLSGLWRQAPQPWLAALVTTAAIAAGLGLNHLLIRTAPVTAKP